MSSSRSVVLSLTLLPTLAAHAAEPTTTLGFPVCEPSAALILPCIGKPGQCLLVGDNETADGVFLYPLVKGQADVKAMQPLKLSQGEVDDIESMAKPDDRTLLLLGSHSRNSSCEIKDKRRRLLLVTDWGRGSVLAGNPARTQEISAAALLGQRTASSPVLKAVGEAIDRAEALADKAAKNKDESACEAASAFNIEGAVAIPGPQGETRVWIGLRSPLVTFNGRTWAALLRLERPHSLGFDQAILLDLGGRGVRELSLSGDWLWGIAGGPGDGGKNFVLWKVKLGDLKPEAQLQPQILRPLPNSSEGLAFVDGQAVVLIDGDRGKDKANPSCREDGKYLILERF